MKPWEKYAQQHQQEQKSEGPWSQYNAPVAQESAPVSEPAMDTPQEPGMLMKAGQTALKGLDYLGGIARTGVAQAADAFVQGDKVPSSDWQKALKGEAPTSAEYMQKLGVPEGARVNLLPDSLPFGEGDTSLRDIGGFAMDIATDPLTYTGIGLVSKPLGVVAKGAGKGIAEVAGKAVQTAGKIGGETFTKGAQALTAAPKKAIEAYTKRTDEINGLIKKFAGDTAEYSDDIKSGINKSIQETKQGLNNSIEKALDAMPDAPAVDVTWVKNDLNAYKKKLNPTLNKEAYKELDEFSGLIDEMSVDGRINVKELNQLKQYMQEQAKGSYRKEGQIFVRSKESAKAAKGIASQLRKQINEISPEIAQANNSLSRLHSLEETMNKNIIKEGGSYNALQTAGSGANQRNRRQLQELSKITGKDFIKDAENLSAFDTFAKPAVLPMDTTGKSLLRTTVAYTLGGIPAAVMTSPVALKAAINAGKVPKNIIKFFGGSGGSKNINALHKAMTSPEGQKLLTSLGNAARVASVRAGKPSSAMGKGSSSEDESMIANLKGEDKWAFDGYANLLKQDNSLSDQKTIEKIFKSKKGRKLLIAASMKEKNTDKILEQLKNIKDGE